MNCVKYVIIFHDDNKHRKSPLKWYILSFGTFLSNMHWFGTKLPHVGEIHFALKKIFFLFVGQQM